MKALILIMSGIGNAVTTVPIIDNLNKKGYKVDLLVNSNTVKKFFENYSEVNAVYKLNFDFLIFSTLKNLQKNNYDYSMTIYPSQGSVSALILYMINSKIRVQNSCSYFSKYMGMKLKRPLRILDLQITDKIFLSKNYKITGKKHAVHIMNDMLENLKTSEKDLKLYYTLNHNQLEFSETFWNSKNLKNKFVIGLHTGTSGKPPFKDWPLEKWEELLLKINSNYPEFKFLLFIGPDEKEHVTYFNELKVPNLDFAKNLNISETISLISKCNFFISADSGLAHCASLFEIPQITMFGPVDYEYIQPFSKNCKILVPENYSSVYTPHEGFVSKPIECMENLNVNTVFEEFEKLISGLEL
jgi:ADP-heptose:LPS heptosyltransferase